jgi:hypothetical protein
MSGVEGNLKASPPARKPDERLPKRVLSGHKDGSGVRGRRHRQRVDHVREDLQIAGFFFTWRRQIPGQGMLKSCHRMSAATQLIYGLEGV